MNCLKLAQSNAWFQQLKKDAAPEPGTKEVLLKCLLKAGREEDRGQSSVDEGTGFGESQGISWVTTWAHILKGFQVLLTCLIGFLKEQDDVWIVLPEGWHGILSCLYSLG